MDIAVVTIIAVAAVAVAQIVGRTMIAAGKAMEASAAVIKDAAWLIADEEQRTQLESEEDLPGQEQSVKNKYDVIGDNVYAIKPKRD